MGLLSVKERICSEITPVYMGGNNDNVVSPESVPIHLKISLCICMLQTDWPKLSTLDHRIKNMLSFVFFFYVFISLKQRHFQNLFTSHLFFE